MRWEGNARINTRSASALQVLDIGAEFLLGIKRAKATCNAPERCLNCHRLIADWHVEWYRTEGPSLHKMRLLTPEENRFLDIFLHEATTAPFSGPATKGLHRIGVEYGDISYIR